MGRSITVAEATGHTNIESIESWNWGLARKINLVVRTYTNRNGFEKRPSLNSISTFFEKPEKKTHTT